MLSLKIGNKIKSLSKKTVHIIESIEIFDSQTVVFTEDIKCFPIDDIQLYYESFVSEFFLKVFSGEKPTKEEEEKLQIIMKKMSLVKLDKSS